jgi:hypothetical protein
MEMFEVSWWRGFQREPLLATMSDAQHRTEKIFGVVASSQLSQEKQGGVGK